MDTYRTLTARKHTTLDEAAIAAPKFARADPMFRAGPEPGAAGRQALRLLVAHTFLWLPAHGGICWLASHSPDLAAAAVIVMAAAALAVAFAKWLALEDLLQKLPLLLVLVLVFVGLAYFPSPPNPSWLSAFLFWSAFTSTPVSKAMRANTCS